MADADLDTKLYSLSMQLLSTYSWCLYTFEKHECFYWTLSFELHVAIFVSRGWGRKRRADGNLQFSKTQNDGNCTYGMMNSNWYRMMVRLPQNDDNCIMRITGIWTHVWIHHYSYCRWYLDSLQAVYLVRFSYLHQATRFMFRWTSSMYIQVFVTIRCSTILKKCGILPGVFPYIIAVSTVTGMLSLVENDIQPNYEKSSVLSLFLNLQASLVCWWWGYSYLIWPCVACLQWYPISLSRIDNLQRTSIDLKRALKKKIHANHSDKFGQLCFYY